jgi:hypothetical protein
VLASRACAASSAAAADAPSCAGDCANADEEEDDEGYEQDSGLRAEDAALGAAS